LNRLTQVVPNARRSVPYRRERVAQGGHAWPQAYPSGVFPFVGENLQPVVEQARRHLAFWSGFPVDSEPRPIVMLGEATLAPDTGFPSNETKEAFLQAAFTMECDAPSSARDDTIVTPAVALERFRHTGSGSGAQPLTITGIRLDAGTFITDRGRRDLPAWAIQFR
jgi:hypothetical protein